MLLFQNSKYSKKYRDLSIQIEFSIYCYFSTFLDVGMKI